MMENTRGSVRSNREGVCIMVDAKEIPLCPFPKGLDVGIRCDEMVPARMGRGTFKKICPNLECMYRG